MDHNIKVFIKKVKNMVKVLILGQMDQNIKECGKIIKFLEKELILG